MPQLRNTSIWRPIVHALAIAIPVGALYAIGHRGRYRPAEASSSFAEGIAHICIIFLILTLFFWVLQFMGVKISFSDQPSEKKPKPKNGNKK